MKKGKNSIKTKKKKKSRITTPKYFYILEIKQELDKNKIRRKKKINRNTMKMKIQHHE